MMRERLMVGDRGTEVFPPRGLRKVLIAYRAGDMARRAARPVHTPVVIGDKLYLTTVDGHLSPYGKG